MKSFLLLSSVLLLQFISHAQQQLVDGGKKNLAEMSASQGTGIFSSTHKTVAGAKDIHLFHVLTLEINTPALTPLLRAKNFSVIAKFTVSTGNSAATMRPPEAKDLKLNYNTIGTYQAKDAFEKADVEIVDYKLVSISVKEENGTPITIDANNQDIVVLKQHLQFDRYLPPNSQEAIKTQQITVTPDKGYANLSWSPVSWALAYDIEYSFIDNYVARGAPITEANALYNFRFNSTRVQLSKTNYEIPLVYESGFLVYRVRPVGYWGINFDKIVTGLWSTPDAGKSLISETVGAEGNFFCKIEKTGIHEDDKKNWQYLVNFSEEGKRKDNVVYFDGTFRNRQEVTNLNTQQNLLVHEIIYDNAGRPAIDVLPTPIIPEGFLDAHIPRIAYQNALNVNSDEKSYSWKDFDIDRLICTVFPDKLNTKSGASKYYSPDNKNFDASATGIKRQMAYVADAAGYPFTQKEYTPDNSGRISRQSSPGPDFSFNSTLNSTHEQKFFYGTPSQQELDRVFGNDIGFASHYSKEINIDGDGQAHVTYKNLKGNVIATALAGDPAPNLTQIIEPIVKRRVTVNLADPDRNRIDLNTRSVTATYPLVIGETTKIDLIYDVTANGFPFSICKEGADNLCYDCVYDLTMKLTDACGVDYINKKIAIGTLNDLRKCESGTSAVSIAPASIQLKSGSYFISKTLTVSDSAINAYIADYLNDPCWNLIPHPEKPVECSVIPYKIQTISIGDGCDTSITTKIRTPKMRFLPQPQHVTGDCEPFVGKSLNDISIQKMLNDLSPKGQDGEYPLTGDIATSIYQYPLSVFNDHNQLPTKGNWRYPVFHYRNKMGDEIFIDKEVNGVIQKLRPEELSLEEFLQNWEPAMAYSLLPYHPEYCYYEWNMAHKDFFEYEDKMRGIADYVTANRTYTSLLKDPYEKPDPSDALFTDLTRATKMTGYMKDISALYPGGGFNSMKLADVAAIAAAGFSADITFSDASIYPMHHKIFDELKLQDEEWVQFRSFYLQARTKIIEEMRNNEIVVSTRPACCMLNDYIGNAECTGGPRDKNLCALFANKKPVFPSQARLADLIAGNSSLPIPAPDSNINCLSCTQPQNYVQFINEMFAKKQLFTAMRITGRLLGMIGNHNTDIIIAKGDHIKWVPLITINTLNAKLVDEETGDVICTIDLATKEASFDWKNIVYFSCLKDEATPNAFTLTAWNATATAFVLQGSSNCFEVKECAPATDLITTCDKKEYTGLFIDMLEKVLKSAAANVIPSALVRGRNPNAAYPEGKDPVSLWHITSNTPVANNFDIPLNFSSLDNTPQFHLSIRSANTLFTNFAEWKITGSEFLSAPPPVDNCKEANTLKLFVQKRSQPQVTDVFEVSFDFPLGTCCTFNKANAFCCMPVMTGLPTVTEPDCIQIQQIQEDNNEEIINNQLKQHFADSLRTQYILHCLHAFEKFTVAYDEQLYHYTLFYYDLAGNLVKTVPPKGVQPLTDDETKQTAIFRNTHTGDSIFTRHTMITLAAFNTTNNVIAQSTPDAGTSRYCYDEADRVIYKQNANQSFNAAMRRASFIHYDSIGRVIQTGEIPISYFKLPAYLSNKDFNDELDASDKYKTDIFTTFYDRMPAAINGGYDFNLNTLNQQNLRNRVSATLFHRSFMDNTPYTHAFYYNYDIEGNIHTVIQDSRFLENYAVRLGLCDYLSFNRFKTISYDYDLISKKVNRTWYQPNQSDQLIHIYEYDADNRLVNVKTTTRIWENPADVDVDASYQFYLHGPLARLELGQEKIQGLDYIYTLQGWMKGVNSSLPIAGTDPGKDDGTVFLKDAFAFGLNYFPGDYTSISKNITLPDVEKTDMGTGFSKPLYSGNIRSMITSIYVLNGKDGIQATSYNYDVLNRLLNMKVYQPKNNQLAIWQNGGFTEPYRTQYNYDANSNLSDLLRKDEVGNAIDQLSYTYTAGTNRSEKIADAVASAVANNLLPDNKNIYDAGGRLSHHNEGPTPVGNTDFTWSAFDRLRNVNKDGMNIEFTSNAASEKAFRYDEVTKTATYYVRDVRGNIIAIYNFAPGKVSLEEFPLYGVNRTGTLRMHTPLSALTPVNELTYARGSKEYELVNHLGNVMVTVSDRRIPDGAGWKADVLTAQDYYPFGTSMAARSFRKSGVADYRYGFNNKEMERYVDERNIPLDFGARMYGSGTGQWFSTDPLENKAPGFSPYNYCMGNPVRMRDPDGRIAIVDDIALATYFFGAMILASPPVQEGLRDALNTTINATRDKYSNLILNENENEKTKKGGQSEDDLPTLKYPTDGTRPRLSGRIPEPERIKEMTKDEVEDQLEITKESIQNRIKDQIDFNKGKNPMHRSQDERVDQSRRHGVRQNLEQNYEKQLEKRLKDFK
ncbi:RHS repeat-associated core domain-containing protein [Chitinophaga rupis]|uniref:RHS repeat-associated core domain-containing protein n=1 Tax=Chitinophaga rupis TaxID=573321 RepID=A0A1H7VXW7_9BACT|nr:RHS repeat-associated core domain-containing protein [Chitinophaga rupis]SEM14106.1 RHS repeat-associated core domain-containing protein [Chitinophaga rupis]